MLLAPVLSTLLFRRNTTEWRNPVLVFLTLNYRRLLHRAIHARLLVLGTVAILLAIALSLAISGKIGLEFLPHLDEGAMPVLAFGVMMTLLAGTFCSAYPVWRAIRTNPADAINNGENHHAHSHTRQYVRRTLLIIQIAAATGLLITSGLLLHTYSRLLATPLGFDADRTTTIQVSLPPLQYSSDSSRRTFYETVVDRIRHLPGISDASACTLVPFGYGENMQPFALANAPTTAAQQLAAVNSVLPGFFETLRIPLVAGRYIDSRAIDYVNRIEKKIILIDGRQLANLSIDFRVGVTEVTSYTIKKIDLDYFEED